MSDPKYDCGKCPGYCCSYPVIQVTKRDAERIARFFGITLAQAERRFFRADHGYKRLMKRQKDEHFGRICQFFDTDQRNCTIYEVRPSTCRDFPGKTCGYWDFLNFERAGQKDASYVSTTWHNED
ncbi:MAG: YkgJ family cysteine cluster protein [Anderseniella sp.]|jgi:Fe-S-cluster containining protein|nr:YkgJ family cysteine cluster protein [Anderseniella sp.]